MITSGLFPEKTAVIGARGFIGGHFLRFFRGYDPETIGTDYREREGLESFDLTSPKLSFSLEGYRYALIAGGIANPVACAQAPKKSAECNVSGTLSLCEQLLQRGVIPILFSTDYVFDGEERLYTESSPHSPLNLYGAQKAQLEKEAPSDALIIRLSKVYGLERGDGTLLDGIAQRLVEGEEVQAAYDQIFAPICITDVIRGVVELQSKQLTGIFNFAGNKAISRYILARNLAHALGAEENAISKISLDDLGDGVRRPKRVILHSSMGKIAIEQAVEAIAEQYARANT